LNCTSAFTITAVSAFSPYQPIGAAFALLATGLIGYFAGWDVRDQELRLEKAQATVLPVATVSTDDEPMHSPRFSTAARVLEENFWRLGVPDDRFITSFEAFWSEETQQLHFLARLWPPWQVSQPVDSVKPLAWRAIEVTADGRCFLCAVYSEGTNPWRQPMENEQFTQEIESAPTAMPEVKVTPGRRRVILPPVDRE